MSTILARSLALAAALALLFTVHQFLARPWYLRWGATNAEVRASLPGDAIVPAADLRNQTTRAITIEAPADRVWAWLAQIGQDRGGFYSYELLEDLVGCEMPRVERLDPALQRWQVGDRLWMYPARKAGGMGHARLDVMDQGRALGFATRQFGTAPTAPYDGSWSFVVQPIDASTTRLIARGRGAETRGLTHALAQLVFDPMHFVMERRMMEGIRQRAEGEQPRPVTDVAQVALWTLALGLLAFAGALVLAGRRGWMGAVTLVAAGVVFQILTFVQPSPAFGLLLVMMLLILVELTGGEAKPLAIPPAPRSDVEPTYDPAREIGARR